MSFNKLLYCCSISVDGAHIPARSLQHGEEHEEEADTAGGGGSATPWQILVVVAIGVAVQEVSLVVVAIFPVAALGVHQAVFGPLFHGLGILIGSLADWKQLVVRLLVVYGLDHVIDICDSSNLSDVGGDHRAQEVLVLLTDKRSVFLMALLRRDCTCACEENGSGAEHLH